MIALDEEALVCDLAETYRILDYRQLPLKLVATLAAGLGTNSRIKQKIRGEQTSLETMLMMSIVDHLKILVWQQTVDGRKGRNYPRSILAMLLDDETKRVQSFATAEDFEKRRQKIIEEVN